MHRESGSEGQKWGGSYEFSQTQFLPNGDDITFQDEISNGRHQMRTDSYRLKYDQAAMFVSIIEDSVTELRILCECNNEFRIIKTLADMEELRALKFKISEPEIKNELDGINPHKLGCTRYKLDKLYADRNFMQDVLLTTYLDLSRKRSFQALVDRIDQVDDTFAHRAFIAEEEAKNKITRREISRQLRQQRNHFKSLRYDTDVITDQLKTGVEDATLNGEVQSRYMTSWQRARTEQHNESIHLTEAGPSDVIKYYRQRVDQEQRVHSEIEMLTNIMMNESLNEVESWMNKYDKDMEAMDLRIQIQKNEYQNIYTKRLTLERTYADHEVIITDWLKFKDDRYKEQLFKEKMTTAAITVQSWWRGLLVRLELGPYKVVRRKVAARLPDEQKKKKKK